MAHELALFAEAMQRNGNGNGNGNGQINRQVGAQALRQVVDVLRSNGYGNGDIQGMLPDIIRGAAGGVQMPGSGSACDVTQMQQTQDAFSSLGQRQGAEWGPWPNGKCPTNVYAFLAWMMAGSCTFNNFGKTSSTALISNTRTLPDARFDFEVFPGQADIGIPFPQEWSGEAAFHQVYRVKVDIEVRPITLVNFTLEELQRRLFADLTLRVIQFGTDDPVTTAVNFGQAQDAQASAFVPSMGGYFFPRNAKFVPWMWEPSIQAYDLSGVAPGVVGEDEYAVTATFRTYWELMKGFNATLFAGGEAPAY